MGFISKLSDNPSTIVAMCALLCSIISIIYIAKSLKVQREHNYKSVKPIASIDLGDYENDIFVRINNNGIGPLKITRMQITNGVINRENLIDILPTNLQSSILWDTFCANIISETIKVDHHVDLLKKVYPGEDMINDTLYNQRNELRSALKSLRITLAYTDIYEKTEYIYEKELSWFGRNLQPTSVIRKSQERNYPR